VKLTIHYPYTSLSQHLDKVIQIPEKLRYTLGPDNCGLEFGYDILPEGVNLDNVNDVHLFTGRLHFDPHLTLGKREMLWIEYNSSEVTKEAVQEVTAEIAKLVGVVPVAAKDWNDKIGLLVVEACAEEYPSEFESLNYDEVGESSRDPDGNLGTAEDWQFTAHLKIASQQLEVEQSVKILFQPSITHATSDRKLVNQISLDPLLIQTTRTTRKTPKIDVKGKGKAPEYSLSSNHPHYVTDQTTITFGVVGGSHPVKLRDIESTPIKNDFNSTMEQGLPPRGPVLFRPCDGTTGYSQRVDIWPNFEGSQEASKCWKYKVLQDGKYDLQCSRRSPPVHNATFLYNHSQNPDDLPHELYTQVTTEFRLTRTKFITLSEMLRSGSLLPGTRHIRVDLKTGFKRTESDMTLEYPSEHKVGAGIEVKIDFERAVGIGIPRTSFIQR
jgi:hypothetical protein